MNQELTLATSLVAVLAAYLAGSIPFGYVITYWVKGIDIRTVGSGNLGATNVGRTLGFRYFLLVFVLDMLKGFLPVWGFPLIVSRLAGSLPPDLPVMVALAAILGHTFPIYLKFRGGKGVATSVGTVLALDPVSCAVAVAVFGGLLVVTRYVSLASLGGGLGFVAAHFARKPSPLSREHIAMSVFSIAVVVLLFVRHRGNLARIWAGTERRVSFGGTGSKTGTQAHPDGKVLVAVVGALVVLSVVVVAGIQVYRQATAPTTVSAGPWLLRETDRAATAQQRVDRVAFAAKGSRLAATCPRYGYLEVYRVDSDDKLSELKGIPLDGRPVALATDGDHFIVLETPSGDQRHVEPGWWECFDFDGNRLGPRHPAGYYPDDLAVSPDGKFLLLLNSGQAEGDSKKPLPALQVLAFDFKNISNHVVGHLAFAMTDDPCRLSLSAAGHCAAVLLAKTNQTLAIDLSVPANPRVIGRIKPTGSDTPYVSYSPDSDWILMPVAAQSEGIAIRSPQSDESTVIGDETARLNRVDYLVCTRHNDSVLELFQTEPLHSLGRLPLKGPLNLGRSRPTGLAYSRERGLLAVATRSGTVHVVAMRPRGRLGDSVTSQVAATRDDSNRH